MCSVKKAVFRDFVKFTGKDQCQSLFFDKVAGLRLATLLKKRLWHRCFSVNNAKFRRTPFQQNTSGRLLLVLPSCYPALAKVLSASVAAKTVKTVLNLENCITQ